MKNTPAVATAIRTRYNLTAIPKATIDWSLNRYFDLTVYNHVPDSVEENDEDIYPVSSIVEPWRPTKGINKARIGYGYAASSYNDWPTARFYVASEKDKYKYWMSPTPSDGNGVLTNCVPTVLYDETVQSNKIRVVVENTWASPVDYWVEYTQDGGQTWINTTAAPVQNDGVIEVFWTGSSWTTSQPSNIAASVPMNGVRIVVKRLGAGRLVDGSITRTRVSGNLVPTTGAGSYLSLIELGAHLVRDVSDMLVSAEDDFDAGEGSVVSPVGTITSNTGSLTMWNRDANGDNIFSRDNQNSPYFKLIEQNAEVTYSLVYEIDNANYEVRQFKLYADNWTEDDESGTITVDLSDASKHLAEVKPLPAKYEGMKFSEIMYRLCDSVGWNYYNVDNTPKAKDLEVPIFWTDGDSTLWEILDDLATVSQSVIYFDENGYMNVRSREDAFDPAAAPVWTLRGQTQGNELADVVSLDRNGEFGSNYVKIIYKNTRWADVKNGFAENSPVWEGEDPTVLRSSPLLYTMFEDSMVFSMPGGNAATWPHTGQVLIEGEVMEYDAKEFKYQDNGWKTAWVSTQSEQDELNERVVSSLRHWNHCTGRFKIKERGQWNTAVKRHAVDAEGYTVTRYTNNGVRSGGGFHFDRRNSLVSLRTAGLLSHEDERLVVSRGVPGDSPWRYIGTKMVFSGGNARHQGGGIVFNMGSGRDGYYVELCPTSQISEKDREVKNEISFYIIKNGVRSSNWPVKGAIAPVVLDMWGELDIWYSIHDQRVKIFYRGKEYFHFNVPGGWQLTPSGKFGMFARGISDISFSYLYASSRHADPEPQGEYSSLHRINGIFEGREFTEEWKHRNTRRQRNKRKKTKKSIFDKRQRFMDEFGPHIHEFKEFEVKFDPAPVANSFLYFTNTWAAYLIDYAGDSFGARFTMVNTERYNAILAGEDSLLNPGAEPVNQYLTVFGRGLVVDEGEEIIAKNEQQIRARGEIVTEIDSNWIQSEEAAREISNWIINHWSDGVDEITVNIFGNPLFHIGDVVAVDHPRMDMAASTHHYFVIGVSNSFDGGVSTALRLRRRN